MSTIYTIDNNEKYNKFVKTNKFIGNGIFGKVFRALYKDKKAIAIKQYQLLSKGQEKLIHSDCETSVKLEHKSLLKTYFGFTSKTKEQGEVYYVGMDYTQKNLKQLLQQKGKLHKTEVFKLSVQLSNGLFYLQQQGVAHKNLKLTNILIDEYGYYKISDISESKMSQEGISTAAYVGAEQYMSPEFHTYIYQKNYTAVKNFYKSDVFSFGLILLQCSIGCSDDELKQLNEPSSQHLIDKTLEQHKEQFSILIYDILKNSLILRVEERYDFTQIQSILTQNWLENNMNNNNNSSDAKAAEKNDLASKEQQLKFLQDSYFEVLEEKKQLQATIDKLKNNNEFNQEYPGYSFGSKQYSNAKYEGIFIKNSREIYGTYYFHNGNKFVGEFRNNHINGYGCFYYANSNKYIGEFRDNKKNGKGIYYYNAEGATKGDIYEGNFKNDVREGYGIYYFANGARYEGYYKNNLREGQGKMYHYSGNIYIGEFQNGKENGKGTFYWPNGSKWEGDFKDGLRDGQGINYKVSYEKITENCIKGQKSN